MKINKVKLYNFSSYEGNNEFDFEITDAEKNIVLIGGKNGAGKTSLFTAIKVALYGPLAYGYVGVNSHYISKIKDLINSKAFQQEIVESEVQITLQLKIERDIRNYVITRKWDYTNQRLTEEYTVERDGKQLNDQELSYFENYLRSIIPPDLFEFFLFDGEEVGNIFSTSAYNTYVRNAVFTMCGMDVFEIIRKFTRGYVTRNNSIDDDEAYDTYESAKQQMELLETEKENLESEVSNLTKELEDIEVQLTELTTAYEAELHCFKVKENRFDVTYHNHGGQLYTLEHFIVPDNRNAKIKWLTKDEESIEISFTGQSERKKKLINYLIVEQKLNNDILLDFDVIKKIELISDYYGNATPKHVGIITAHIENMESYKELKKLKNEEDEKEVENIRNCYNSFLDEYFSDNNQRTILNKLLEGLKLTFINS